MTKILLCSDPPATGPCDYPFTPKDLEETMALLHNLILATNGKGAKIVYNANTYREWPFAWEELSRKQRSTTTRAFVGQVKICRSLGYSWDFAVVPYACLGME